MNTVARKKARWIIPGLSAALLGGLYWSLHSDAEDPGGAPASTELSELGAGLGPQLEPFEDVMAAEAGAAPERSNLPPDAGILPVAEIPYGNGSLEVVAGEVLAKFSSAISTEGRDRLIARMGSAVLEDDPITGYVRLKVPDGHSIVAFQQLLRSVEGVITAHPNVLMQGAGNRCTVNSAAYYGYQWNLNQFNHSLACSSMPDDPAPVTVAVLDSGCAYRSTASYAQAQELADVPIVAPYDFINGDAYPDDDNGHGTHIAATALGVGKINGVTPGATLMPIKVLDAYNRGTELALAQGIRHAVDNGADILNMSLSFPPRYVPSGLLGDAVAYAAKRGVLMIASSGNNGKEGMPYPAQYKDVMSIGSVRMKRLVGGSIVPDRASYSAYGSGLDAVTWGGHLSYDANRDNYPDGILGPSIAAQDPSRIRYVFYVGTSQAAAQASGIAAWLVAAGATPKQARDVMLQTATDLGSAGYDKHYGQGMLSLYEALSFWQAQQPTATPKLYANILPVVYKEGGMEWGVARVRVTNELGNPVANAKVYGEWTGAANDVMEAVTDANGELIVASPQVTDDSIGSLFALQVNTIVDPISGRTVRPGEFYYLGQGLAALLDGALSEEATLSTLMAFHVEPDEPSLGAIFDSTKLAECYSIKALGPSLSTPGIGMAFTPDLIPGLAEGTIGKQDIVIQFGGTRSFGYGTADSGVIRVYSGGVGLALSSMGKSGGVGLALSSMGKSGGVGLALSSMGRLGGVGLALSSMSIIKMDTSLITGMTVSEPAEFIKAEDPESFLASNSALEGKSVGINLGYVRFAANSVDVAELDAVMSAASADEAEAELVDSGLANGEELVDIEEAVSLNPSQEEEPE